MCRHQSCELTLSLSVLIQKPLQQRHTALFQVCVIVWLGTNRCSNFSIRKLEVAKNLSWWVSRSESWHWCHDNCSITEKVIPPGLSIIDGFPLKSAFININSGLKESDHYLLLSRRPWMRRAWKKCWRAMSSWSIRMVCNATSLIISGYLTTLIFHLCRFQLLLWWTFHSVRCSVSRCSIVCMPDAPSLWPCHHDRSGGTWSYLLLFFTLCFLLCSSRSREFGREHVMFALCLAKCKFTCNPPACHGVCRRSFSSSIDISFLLWLCTYNAMPLQVITSFPWLKLYMFLIDLTG